MSRRWTHVPLNEVCLKTQNIKWNGLKKSYKYIDLTSVSRETLTIQETSQIDSDNAPSRAKKIVHASDVIFATTRPTLRRVAIIPPDYDSQICSTGFTVLRPIKSNLDSRYLFYFLNTDGFYDRMESIQRGTSYPAVTDKDVKSTTIPIPPLAEQQQIVSILDLAFAAIDQTKANLERNIENAKELFQSKLNEIFSQQGEGWEEKTLGEIGKIRMCKRIFKDQTSTSGDIPFYKIGTFGREPNAFISNELYNEYRKKYSFPKKGDVLLSASGTIGRRVVYDGQPGYFQDSNIVWIDNDENEVSNEFLYQFYGFCDWGATKGATISRLYNDNLRQIRITHPSLDKQAEIVKELNQLDEYSEKLRSVYQSKLTSLEELKKSILQRAFSGELTKLSASGLTGLEDEQDLGVAAEPEESYNEKSVTRN